MTYVQSWREDSLFRLSDPMPQPAPGSGVLPEECAIPQQESCSSIYFDLDVSSEAVAGEVLAVEDLQGLLEGLDLLLARGDLVLVGLADRDALRLQLLVVLHRAVQLLLGPREVALLRLERLVRLLLLRSLVPDVPVLRGLVHLSVVRELPVLLHRLLLSGGGVR